MASLEMRFAAWSAVTGLRSAHRSPWKMTVLVIWAVATVVDAATTMLLLDGDAHGEGNPVAQAVMSVAGVGWGVLAASVLSVMFAVFATAEPVGPYSRTAVTTTVLLGLGKLAVATHNALLLAFG